jgi:hypothetical protein
MVGVCPEMATALLGTILAAVSIRPTSDLVIAAAGTRQAHG